MEAVLVAPLKCASCAGWWHAFWLRAAQGLALGIKVAPTFLLYRNSVKVSGLLPAAWWAWRQHTQPTRSTSSTGACVPTFFQVAEMTGAHLDELVALIDKACGAPKA